jgi:SAM-dependent methyltransferase
MVWDRDCWDACVDKSYPRDFAKQWVLWEAGRLGDPNLVYGNDPEKYFQSLLKCTCLTEQDLKSKKILEIGYGHGRLLQKIQELSPTAYGIDLARPPKSARLRPGSAIFGNLLSIPFMPGQFDLVICRGVIHHTPEPSQSFKCVAEQVAPKGLLYLGGHYEPRIKGSLVLRKILPWSWRYPEFLRLSIAHILCICRAAMESVQKREISYRAFKTFCAHYALDIFDVISPRWSHMIAKEEVESWFISQNLLSQRMAPGEYVGMRQIG